jgi:hypothetical protein
MAFTEATQRSQADHMSYWNYPSNLPLHLHLGVSIGQFPIYFHEKCSESPNVGYFILATWDTA